MTLVCVCTMSETRYVSQHMCVYELRSSLSPLPGPQDLTQVVGLARVFLHLLDHIVSLNCLFQFGKLAFIDKSHNYHCLQNYWDALASLVINRKTVFFTVLQRLCIFSHLKGNAEMKAREGTVTGSEFSTGNLHKQVTSSPGLILMQSLSLYVCVYV